MYLGTLNYADPLYDLIFSQACPDIRMPVFHVNAMSHSMVFKYTEEKSGTAIIGKFFRLDDGREDRISRIKGEYENLHRIRRYGFDRYPNYVVRPIGKDERIGLALLEEFIHGKDLDYYLKKAIYSGDGNALERKLSSLASFFYVFHKKTETQNKVDLDSVSIYFQKIINKLSRHNTICDEDRRESLRLMDKWLNRSIIQDANGAMVHGDATPTNFIFTEQEEVVAIDLERMKVSDQVFDIGMVCGEIKHAFLWRTGNPHKSEHFINHFLSCYASHFPDRKKTFHGITFRNPFYMAMTELRIARNSYLDPVYRKGLAFEALKCLKWGLKLR